jgi:hypothetical protein
MGRGDVLSTTVRYLQVHQIEIHNAMPIATTFCFIVTSVSPASTGVRRFCKRCSLPGHEHDASRVVR